MCDRQGRTGSHNPVRIKKGPSMAGHERASASGAVRTSTPPSACGLGFGGRCSTATAQIISARRDSDEQPRTGQQNRTHDLVRISTSL